MRRKPSVRVATVPALTLLLLAATALGGQPAGAAPSATLTVGTQQLTACDAVEINAVQAWCGSLVRPWDPADPASETFTVGYALTLPVGAARAAAAAPTSAATSALVALQGGPGWGSISSAPDFADMFGDLLKTRAMLTMDQRGTGLSGSIDCDDEIESGDTWQDSVRLCAAKLGSHYDLFGSSLAADDLAAIINALGLGPSNIYGVSYGTFFGQVFAGRHPELTRSLLLDSAYPAVGETGWVETFRASAKDAVNAVCAREPACARRPGTSAGRLAQVVRKLRARPVTVKAPSPDGTIERVTLDPSTLADLVIDAGYGGLTFGALDASLRAALLGDWLPLGRLVAEWEYDGSSHPAGNGIDEANEGHMYAVVCQDYPQIVDMQASPAARPAQYEAAVAVGQGKTPGFYSPFTIDEFRGTGWWDLESCLDWPASTRYPSRSPTPPAGTYGTFPTLVLSGDLDLVTTTREGAMVAAQFPDSRQVIVANAVHGTAGTECIDGLVQQFVTDPSAVVAGAGGACAADEPRLRLVAGYPRTRVGISSQDAAARTVGDVILRIDLGPGEKTTTGHGLRGGTWRETGYGIVNITLKEVKLYDDFPVSGTVRWNVDTGDVSARLRVPGGSVVRRWNDLTDPVLATTTRVD